MKPESSLGWAHKNHPSNQHQHHQLPHSSSPAPSARTVLKPPSLASFRSVFNRTPSRARSTASLNSSYSGSSSTNPPPYSSPDTRSLHPYAMVAAPLPVVSSRDPTEDEDECPVCLEPLSFSFRLPGEKPHIVPECGHALHEACFVAVYGPLPNPSRAGNVIRKSSLGVCGVCRRPMKVGDGDGGKSNKLAALTGMGDPNSPHVFPGRDTPSSMWSLNGRHLNSGPRAFDPTEDDPLDHHAVSVRSGMQEQSNYIVSPSIQVRSEFSSLTRTSEASQPLTCIVVVELPGKRVSTHVPGTVMPLPEPYGHKTEGSSSHSVRSSPLPEYSMSPPGNGNREPPSRAQTMSPMSQDSPLHPHHLQEETVSEDSPFNAITEDLRNRIIDWKGHPLSGLGPLQMYDLLAVRRDTLVREFFVYLFKEAIICVVEEKKRTLGRLLSSASGAASAFSDGSGMGPSNAAAASKGVLRLKGRIYIRHIKQVTDTSLSGELSLTIDMEDERLDSFILIFKDRSSLETWKAHIQSLVAGYQQNGAPLSQSFEKGPADLEEFGGSSKAARMLSEDFGGSQKAMRMLSGSTGTTASTTDSLLHNGSVRSTISSQTSYGSVNGPGPRAGLHPKLSTLEEDEEFSRYNSPTPLVAPHLSAGPSNSLTPLPHPPLDLILIVSVPSPSAAPGTAEFKLRVLRASLDFILASLGQRDRLSLVSFEVGVGGRVRKTPFLSAGKPASRGRLKKFVDDIGRREDGSPYEDEFLVRGSQDDKTDVVTAVNHGLDVVLQRKSRNPVTGMVLVSDAADTTRRAQMDLVLARTEAANVPIHSFGFGRSHDPASLWLMSNHTSGTYTFVKDWYDLRECLAGCIGGMMSIGLLHMKMHMKIVDGYRFRIRKISGGPMAILSSDGRHVDIELGELRYGERKEMLVELELDNSDLANAPMSHSHSHSQHPPRALNATDQFNQRMGLDTLSIGDIPDLADGMMDRMIDEVPVFEVDGSFYDPAATKHISRLAHPVLLTVTLLPTTGSRPRTPVTNGSDPVIVRRRMELLASDMITRALVLVSRKNIPQAQKLLAETRRILHTVLQNVSQSLPPPGREGFVARNRKDILTLTSVRALQAVLQDMQILTEALEESADVFAHDQRNFGAQQAMILRDQKSWSARSSIERLFWTIDNSIELVSRSTDWVARE